MKTKSEMMNSLHQKRLDSGFVKKSYWVHKDLADNIHKKLIKELNLYWQNSELPNNKKSN